MSTDFQKYFIFLTERDRIGMNIFNINVPKDEISMIFDPYGDIENYSTSIYLHKSKIALDDEKDKFSAHVEIDLSRNERYDKLVKQMVNRDYGTFLTTMLNADFSSSEKAYYSFFAYYGIEGTHSISLLNETNPTLYATRYISTKQFLSYYDKTFSLVKDKYISFQSKLKKIVDYVFNLNEYRGGKISDKYAKLMAISRILEITEYTSFIRLSQYPNGKINEDNSNNIKYIDKIAAQIANKESNIGVMKHYSSKSHLALAYMALTDLVMYGKRNISTCQNCGRYYLQYSGKEVYCDLPNQDGSPSCKTFASRKVYADKVTEDVAELTYKREYQRRITKVYRAPDDDKKDSLQKEYSEWRVAAREQLLRYRNGEISSAEFMNWIEEHK